MSLFYTIKTEEELRQIALTLCDNFAPLIGCKLGRQMWSPPVAYEVCSKLQIKNGICTNVTDTEITQDFNIDGEDTEAGQMTYAFSSFVGYEAKTMSDYVLKFSPLVLDTWYHHTVDFDINLTDEEKFKRVIAFSQVYDSTIFTAAYKNAEVHNSDVYLRILAILLMAYVVRYYLFEYGTGNSQTFNTATITQAYIDRIIGNCHYIKVLLETSEQEVGDYETSKDYIRKQLTYLIKNLQQTKYGLLGEFNY